MVSQTLTEDVCATKHLKRVRFRVHQFSIYFLLKKNNNKVLKIKPCQKGRKIVFSFSTRNVGEGKMCKGGKR